MREGRGEVEDEDVERLEKELSQDWFGGAKGSGEVSKAEGGKVGRPEEMEGWLQAIVDVLESKGWLWGFVSCVES